MHEIVFLITRWFIWLAILLLVAIFLIICVLGSMVKLYYCPEPNSCYKVLKILPWKE
ncbi:MAG: hypothetical protein ACFE94_18570 [Candidatus Hodarchaeota archaeon]